jgi:hypothetical protein
MAAFKVITEATTATQGTFQTISTLLHREPMMGARAGLRRLTKPNLTIYASLGGSGLFHLQPVYGNFQGCVTQNNSLRE